MNEESLIDAFMIDTRIEVALVYTLGCPGDVRFRMFWREPWKSSIWIQVACTRASYGGNVSQFDDWLVQPWILDGPVVDVAELDSTSYTNGMLYGELCGRNVEPLSTMQSGRIRIMSRDKEEVAEALRGGFGDNKPSWY